MNRKRADLALVERGFFESRARAQEAIAAGLVTQNGIPVRKASEMIAENAVVSAERPHPYVSRGGLKLAAALDAFAFDPQGRFVSISARRPEDLPKSCCFAARLVSTRSMWDTASSTRKSRRIPGCAASRARMRGGLDPILVPDPIDLLVADVSFISLKLVLPAAVALLKPGAALAVLVKPQFEAGRDRVKKGIVRDEAVHRAVCEDMTAFITSLGLTPLGLIASPIEGGDGNREFLLGARLA